MSLSYKNINGLYLINDFINGEEENNLIYKINNSEWTSQIKRKVQHYGYIFDYKNKKINKNSIIELPEWVNSIIDKLKNINFLKDFNPNQCTINEYIPGIGISPHIDTHSSFTNIIISISLQNQIVMNFKDKTKNDNKIEILLPPKSLLILKDTVRYSFTHGISWRKTDNINGKIVRRNTRLSITLREIIQSPCKCKWSKLCDSQKAILENTRL